MTEQLRTIEKSRALTVDINHPAITAGKETAFVFVGQGVQKMGMGKQLYEQYEEARKVYDTADRITEKFGYKVTDVSFNGPNEKLALTRFAQPAIFTWNHAYFSVLKQQLGENFVPPGFAAGYSLGEINALTAFGAVDFEIMLTFINSRAEITQRACDENPGGMLSVRIKETEDAVPTPDQRKMFAICIRQLRLLNLHIGYIVNPFHFGVGGNEDSIKKGREWLEEYRRQKGADIQFTRLPVNGAFHTPLMNSAVENLSRALSEIEISPTSIPIIANTTGRPIQNPLEIRQEVSTHLTDPIRWYKSIQTLQRRRVVHTLELGDKPIVSRMSKRQGQEITPVVTKDRITIAHLLTNKDDERLVA